LRATGVGLVMAAAAIACGGGKPSAEPTTSKTPEKEEFLRAPGEGTAVVSEDDCSKWTNQFTSVTKSAGFDEIHKCATRAAEAGDRAVLGREDDGKREFARGVDKISGQVEGTCAKGVGKYYAREDARCFMGAKTIADWQSCDFKTPYFSTFKDWSKDFVKEMETKCDELIDKEKKAHQGEERI
jgi:hypothetical protein